MVVLGEVFVKRKV